MSDQSAVEFERVTKWFGPVVANRNITFQVAAGTVHAIVGENGAGKTTLMRILSGGLRADEGTVSACGHVLNARSPRDTIALGIGMVYQKLSLILTLTVFENLLLGSIGTPFLIRDHKRRKDASLLLEAQGLQVDLDTLVSELTLAQRQLLEIGKLLWRNARILILDEPTSQLAPHEIDEVLRTTRKLANAGRTVLLITHKIDEVLRFADSVTVLRGGEAIATAHARDLTRAELGRLIVGPLQAVPSVDTARALASVPVASLRSVSLTNGSDRTGVFDLDVYGGEVLGIAGVSGNGPEDLAQLLVGSRKSATGEIQFHFGVDVPVAHIPADSRRMGAVDTLPLSRNVFLREFDSPRLCIGPFVRLDVMRNEAASRLKAYGVRPSNPDLLAAALSGGNLQKLIIAREMSCGASLLVAENPTAGLDPASAGDILQRLKLFAREGPAVVLVSADLSELLAISDRVAVFSGKRLIGVERSENLTADSLGMMMGGIRLDIVQQLTNIGTNDGQGLEAIRRLLTSANWWERRVAAQAALLCPDFQEDALIDSLYITEQHEEVRVWLALLQARMRPAGAEILLSEHAERSPEVYLEVVRRLLGTTDNIKFGRELAYRSENPTSLWEAVLYRTGAALWDNLSVASGGRPS